MAYGSSGYDRTAISHWESQFEIWNPFPKALELKNTAQIFISQVFFSRKLNEGLWAFDIFVNNHSSYEEYPNSRKPTSWALRQICFRAYFDIQHRKTIKIK